MADGGNTATSGLESAKKNFYKIRIECRHVMQRRVARRAPEVNRDAIHNSHFYTLVSFLQTLSFYELSLP